MQDTPLASVFDYASLGVVIATIAGILPTISVILSIVWLVLRIWESETIREWTGRVKEKHDDHKAE